MSRTYTAHVSWRTLGVGCLGLAVATGMILLAVAVQAVLSVAAVLVEMIANG